MSESCVLLRRSFNLGFYNDINSIQLNSLFLAAFRKHHTVIARNVDKNPNGKMKIEMPTNVFLISFSNETHSNTRINKTPEYVAKYVNF